MLLELGSKNMVQYRDVIGIFAAENFEKKAENVDLLEHLKQINQFVECTEKKIHSYILCIKNDKLFIYGSSFQTKSLMKRINQERK